MSDVGEATLLAEMQVNFDFQGRQIRVPARVVQHMKPNPRVVIQISDFPWSYELFRDNSLPSAPKHVLTAPAFSEGPSEVQLENGTIVKVVPVSLIFGKREFELHLRQNPCIVLNSNDLIHELQFDVLNFTSDVLNWPVILGAQDWELRIVPVEHRSQLVEKLRDTSGYAVTHKGTLKRRDDEGFEFDEVQPVFDGFDVFLSFLSGSASAISNASGVTKRGDVVWMCWGSRHVSAWERQRSCMDVTTSHEVSVLFRGFMEVFQKTPEYTGRIIALYVSSNGNNSADLSIILSQIALEMLAIMSMDEEVSNEEKIGNRIATLLQKRGIDCIVPESFCELRTLAKKHGWQHGPHALVAIRNSLVHPDNKLGLISINAYYEAKQLGLWYLELLLLKLFGYEGEYASRLEPVQMDGCTEMVPWARGQ